MASVTNAVRGACSGGPLIIMQSLRPPPIVHETLSSPGQPLEAGTRAFMEFRFGHDFSQVRVHSDSKAAASAQAVNAMAYTVGRDVVFGAEQYRPQTSEGTRLLAHELAHVVHQSQAPGVLPIRSTYSNAGDAAEKEADVAAGKVLASNGPVAISQRFPHSHTAKVRRRYTEGLC